jgi:hypothetical protein
MREKDYPVHLQLALKFLAETEVDPLDDYTRRNDRRTSALDQWSQTQSLEVRRILGRAAYDASKRLRDAKLVQQMAVSDSDYAEMLNKDVAVKRAGTTTASQSAKAAMNQAAQNQAMQAAQGQKFSSLAATTYEDYLNRHAHNNPNI